MPMVCRSLTAVPTYPFASRRTILLAAVEWAGLTTAAAGYFLLPAVDILAKNGREAGWVDRRIVLTVCDTPMVVVLWFYRGKRARIGELLVRGCSCVVSGFFF